MKKTFKRFLSSALAAVMAASVLSVGMVTSAFAARTDAANLSYGKVELNEAKNVKTWTFDVNMPSADESNVNLVDGDTIWGITYNESEAGKAGSLKKGTDNCLMLQTSKDKSGNTISIPVPVGSSGEIDIICRQDKKSGSDIRKLTFTDGEEKEILMSKTSSPVEFTSAATGEGKLVLTAKGTDNSAKEFQILSIKITLKNSATFPELVFPEDDLTVLSGETSFTVDNSKDVINNASNFIAEGVTGGDKNGVKFGSTGSIEFKVNANALLTVTYKSGSSGNISKTSAITLSKFDGKAVFDGLTPIIDKGYEAPGNNTHYNLVCKLEDAGVYKLDLSATNSTQIMSINVEYGKDAPVDSTDAEVLLKSSGIDKVGCIRKGDTYYVISVVDKDTAANKTYLKQYADNKAITLGDTSTVYTELELDGTIYKPSDLMSDATDDGYYVFASALDGSTGNDNVKIVPKSVASVLGKVETVLE